jgi:hypothetical protein
MQLVRRPWNLLGAIIFFLILAAGAPALAQSLEAHWKLNESSGTSASDSSGSGHTGTVTGTTSWVSAMCNNGFSFNGSTKIQTSGLLGNPANITVMAWANLTNADTSGAEIISLGDCFILRLDESGITKGIYYNGSSWISVNINQNYESTGWHHFAIVFDDSGNTFKLYVDGALAASTATSSSILYSGLGTNTVIGRHGNGNTSMDFTGTIDDVRVYDYALSASDIQDIYSKIGHWKLDESSGTSASDSSMYGRTGTVTGTSTWAAAVINNGFTFNGSTKIQASGLLGSPSSFTIAAWANLTTADTNGSEIISLGDRVYLRLDEAGVAKIAFYNGSSFVTASYAVAYVDTGWHHFAGVFSNSGDTLKLYVDGVQVASTSTTSNVSYFGAGSNTVIGRHGNSGTNNDFTGSIDDVQVYNRALSASEVAELYGFVGYWKLNQTSGTTATDSSPFGANGTLSGTAHWSTDCGGMTCFDFDGSTNYFSTTSASQLQPTTALTITAWIKGDTWGAGSETDTILRKGDASPNNYIFAVADGKVMLCLDEADTAGIRSTTTLSTGQWYHVAATWDGSTVKIYIDGVLNTSTSRTGTIGTDTRTLYMGGRSGGTDMFNGMIRDVRFYNRALSANDVKHLAGLVGYWAFSEGSGTTAADSSGDGNTATLSGGASWTSDCTGNNNALLTNGTGGIAQTATAFTPPDIGTVAFWMRSTGAPAATARIMGLGGDWEIRQLTDGTVVSDLCGDGNTSIATTTPLTEVGTWYHFAATFDSSNDTYAIYVNGQLERSGTNSSPMTQQAAAILSFGTRTGTSEYWSGALRDVRVYDRKLCPTEIDELYGLVGYWKLDESSGTTATDSSGLGRNASVVGTASWTAGKVNNCLQLNGSTRAEVTNLMGSPKNVTLAAWANLTGADTNGAEVISIGNYFTIRLNESGASKALFYNGSTWVAASISQTYTNAGWKHFAAVFNDNQNTCKFYVNGTEVASVSTTVTIPYSGQGTKTVIGAHGNSGTTYDLTGKIDEVRIYNRALCPTEIQKLGSGSPFGGVKLIKWVEIQ